MLQYRKVIRWAAMALLCASSLPLTGTSGMVSAEEPVSTPALEAIFDGNVPHGIEQLQAMQTRLQSLSKKVIPTTVAVQVGQAQGSGVIVSKDGYVLTAAHVAGHDGRAAMIVLHDGRRVRGKTLGLFRTMDAGLVKIQTPPKELGLDEWPFASMGDSKELKTGQWCLATGHPGGFQSARTPVVRLGRILALDEQNAITSDCTLVGGDSGGPLFNIDGDVIGIHSRIGGPLTLNLHVPVDAYRESWDRLAAGNVWGSVPGSKPYIGVIGQTDTDVARITQVVRGTPAEKAGIRVGDVIVKIGRKKIDSFQALKDFVVEQEPGRRVEVVVRRGEDLVTLQLTIGKRRDFE